MSGPAQPVSPLRARNAPMIAVEPPLPACKPPVTPCSRRTVWTDRPVERLARHHAAPRRRRRPVLPVHRSEGWSLEGASSSPAASASTRAWAFAPSPARKTAFALLRRHLRSRAARRRPHRAPHHHRRRPEPSRVRLARTRSPSRSLYGGRPHRLHGQRRQGGPV